MTGELCSSNDNDKILPSLSWPAGRELRDSDMSIWILLQKSEVKAPLTSIEW
jgi:hypothetical protein